MERRRQALFRESASVKLRLGLRSGGEGMFSGGLGRETRTFFDIFVRKLLLHERYL